jgi:uncharacterized protein
VKMTGEQKLAVPRRRVWEALNDPAVLMLCLPGCQSLERESAERMTAVLAIKVGPIGARFASVITVSEVDPPNSYTLTVEGQGGTAGIVNGSAQVRLTGEGDATLLSYEVAAKIGGRLAQLGGPIVDATAKRLASSFFKKFGERVTAQFPTAAVASTPESVPQLPSQPS